MKIDFSKPQKQSKTGVFVLFFYSLQRSLRASVALLVVFAINSEQYLSKIYLMIGFIVLMSMVYTFINYYYFTFQIDNNSEELIISKGFVKKTKISIQMSKIQQTNLNQTLLHKIFNLYEFQVDTAGSSKKEVEIKALTGTVAQQLKQTIIELKSDATSYQKDNEELLIDASNEKGKFISIDFLTLVKTGITSKYVETFAWLIVGLNTLWENQKTFKIDEKIDTSSVENYINFNSMLTLTLIGVVVTFLLVILINLFRTVIKYFDFTITKTKNALVLNYGLLTTRNISINPLKVQLIAITQNFFQKKLDLLNLKIEQASSDVNTKQKKKDKIEIPGCTALEKDKVFNFIYNENFGESQIFYPSIRKFIFTTLFFIVLPISALIIFNIQVNLLIWEKIIPIMTLYFLVGTTCSWLAFKNSQLKVTPNFIMVQSGFWDINTSIIENYKVQAVKVKQFFWQKRTNIASVTIYTAGGNLHFSTGFYNEMTTLTNYWLYQVETNNKKWV